MGTIYIKSKLGIAHFCKGFEQAGINEALTLELEKEDLFVDLDCF